MRKILFLSYYYYPPVYSGKLLAAVRRFQAFNPSEFELVVYTGGLKGYARKECAGHIHINRSPYLGEGKIGNRLTIFVYWFWSLVKLLLERDISVLHFDESKGISLPLIHRASYITYWLHFICMATVAQMKGIRTIFEHAISDRNGHFEIDSWNERFYTRLDTIVCVSNALYDAVSKVFPVKSKKIVYGIEDDILYPLGRDCRNSFRREHGVETEQVVFCFLGMIVERKGFDLISTVFPEVMQSFPNSVLWCIGPKDHQESRHVHDDEVQIYLNKLDPVRNQVKFWGRIDDRQDIARIIGSSDVFIFPTRKEGMPLAPLEAMATGVPVIISRIPGVTDLANIHGETGLYIEPGQPDELKQAMLTLAGNAELRETMGRNARKRILDEFSWKPYISRWECFYNE